MAEQIMFKQTSSEPKPVDPALTATQAQRVNVAVPKTISNNTATEIRRKAEAGIQLDTSTPEKQALYDQFQERSKQLIVQRARDGGRLHDPNAWKNSVYEQARANLNPNDASFYNSDNIMLRQENEAKERMGAMQGFLETSRDGYMDTQEAMLGKARDQQVADLQKALEDAVTDGKISVREAEAAFAEQKGVIEQEGYNDAERTKLGMSARGIQNSAQSLGMEAGDNARRTSMINKNMSERDMRIATIKDRVNAIKNKTSIDTGMANANYNYGLAGAQGQADMQYSTQMFDMQNQDLQTTRQQQFALDQQGSGERFQKNMAAVQQNYTLEQFAVQQGYDLEKMSVQDKYALNQMYQSHTYGMAMQNDAQSFQGSQNYYDRQHQSGMQDDAQNFQGGQNALDRGHQKDMQDDQQFYQGGENAKDRQHQAGMQAGAQTWQSGENSLSRNHELGMIGEKHAYDMAMMREQHALTTSGVVDEYSVALSREMAKYTPGTPEHDLALRQKTAAEEAMRKEFQFKAEVEAATQVLEKGGIPISPGKKPTPPSKTWYQDLRSQFATVFSDKTGIGINSKDLEAKRTAAYNAEVKAWEQADAAYKQYQKVYGN